MLALLDRMNQKRVFLAIAFMAVALITGVLLKAAGSGSTRLLTVSFLGFSNALPFLAAPEEIRSLQGVFEVTNHTAWKMGYLIQAHGYEIRGMGSSSTQAGGELPGNGTGTFMVSTAVATNGWKFEAVVSISKPRPDWQQRVREIAKKFGAHSVFIGPARTYPPFTNKWTIPQL